MPGRTLLAQTAFDLLAAGYQVFVAAVDATADELRTRVTTKR